MADQSIHRLAKYLQRLGLRYGSIGRRLEDRRGTDGFLVLDGHARLLPNDYLPIAELLPLFSTLPVVTDAALIERHVNRVRMLYVNEEFGRKVAAHSGTMMRPEMP